MRAWASSALSAPIGAAGRTRHFRPEPHAVSGSVRRPAGGLRPPPGQAQRLQRPDLLPLGGKPPPPGVLEDVIEREQVAEPDPGGGPRVRDSLQVQRAVQGLGGNAAEPGGGGKAIEFLLDAVAGPVAKSGPGAGHQGPDLGPKFFAGGIGRVRLAPKGGQQDRTVAPVRVAGSVAKFVQEGLVIALRVAESVLRRQDDPVVSQVVTGSVAGFVETVHAAGQQHELDPFLPRPGRSVPVPELREEQALGLIDVEKSGRALYRTILRRRGIKILGREARDACLVLGNPAPGGFDPGPGAPARVRVSLLDGPGEKMQSLDADVGLPGREALGPDPILGGVVALPGGLAVPELVEDPPGEGLQDRARFARWGSAAPVAYESHLFRERGSGNRVPRPENTRRRKPLSGSSLGVRC